MSFCICEGKSPEVDEPNTVVGEAALLARASNSCFNSRRSGALSCTKSTSVTASSGVETNVMVPSCGRGASVSLRYARRALPMISPILRVACGSMSYNLTSTPLSANLAAHAPPMTPPPSRPTVFNPGRPLMVVPYACFVS